MNKLKPLQIKHAAVGKHPDGGGLYFVRTTESAKWVYRYSIAGRRREMGLGAYPAVSLAEARRDRDRWASEIREGRDPISEREKQRNEERATLTRADPTFEELALMVFEAKKPGLRGDGKRGRWFSPIQTHLIPKLGRQRVSQIHQVNVADALRPIWRSKPATAEKAAQRLRIIFKQGRFMGFEVDPFTIEAAIHMLGEVKREVKHIAATNWRDIPALYARLDKPIPSHRALRLMILTAVRAYPARAAMRNEFDDGLWTVPADRMKGREGKAKPFRVPLSMQAQAEVDTWLSELDGAYLFSSRTGRPVTDRSIEVALDAVGETGRPHGFRTSFRTWVQDTEAATYDVAETALAHIIGNKVERSYARSDLLDQRRALMQRWADFVTGAEAKVVKFRS
ncbi:integrase arm-type DNA-binding domain-containing protein [Breoghania sp.]|uniref:tyrosine-type recombinase/integrase n=1 Tax=Breoghania sp. TaxID=2065378 RepID=UPI002AA8B4C7|nr:integrase arm-type DNA-binding domain-containing protein [Breoghania sp.]